MQPENVSFKRCQIYAIGAALTGCMVIKVKFHTELILAKIRKNYHCFNGKIFKLVFGVGQLNYASQIWLRQTLVAMVTKICDF